MSGKKQDPYKRFWKKVDVKGPDECWNWIGTTTGKPVGKENKKYGCFDLNGKSTIASRASWILNRGEIPEEMCVLHKCDNPLCVNPNHLYLGTLSDNSRDMYARNRHHNPTGDQHWTRRDRNKMMRIMLICKPKKLTPVKVQEIRQLANDGCTYTELARQYGVSTKTISDTVSRKYWKDVP